jgi:uncharacterized protein DUF4190/zinc ribbon protein
MNCTTCGEPLEPGALFCANCGARVAPASSAAAPTIVLPAGPAPPPAEKMPPPAHQQQSYGDQFGAPQIPMAPQPMYAPTSPPNSNAAVISLVFGILAWVGLVFIGAIVAVVAGHMARNEIRASGGRIGGGGMATAGLLLGYIQIGLMLLACVALLLFLTVSSTTTR